jgi:hypothetical protein
MAAGALEAGAAIDSTLSRRRVDLDGAAAWGQYLDEDRYSPAQWGLLGTTAAVATLALRARPPENNRHLREALLLIPEERTHYDPRIEDKVEKGDFKNLIRLSFIAEALCPGQATIAASARPDIVRDLLSFSRGDPYWHPRSALDGPRPREGDPFTTAYVLYTLRRYEDPPGELQSFRLWLAKQLETRAAVRSRPDLLGLIGLALTPDEPDPAEPHQIGAAIDRCKRELHAWQQHEPGIVLDRPLFHGFNLGDWTDYTFLHPEIVASLFLLRVDNPRPTRRYVAHVTRALIDNIARHDCFEGQPGMAATVDQMWASKLLDAFHRTHADPTRRHILRPLLIATGRMRWVIVALVVSACAIVAAVTGSPATGGIGAVLAVIIAAAINIAVNWAQRDGST